jgi:hypothetical protein
MKGIYNYKETQIREYRSLNSVCNPQIIPTDNQNFFKYVLEFTRDTRKTETGKYMGSLYWNFVSIDFCFQMVRYSFTLENIY